MQIRPNLRRESGSQDPPKELGPFWWVSESDRHVMHQITLAEVLGLSEPEGGSDQHRVVALNYLRNAIFNVLRDGMPAEAIAPDEYSAPGGSDGGGDQCAFGRNARLARQSLAMLCERPSFDWPVNVSPFTWSLQVLVTAFRDGKQRLAGKRDEADVWWARVIAQLETALAVAEARLTESTPRTDESAAWREVGTNSGNLPEIRMPAGATTST